MSRVGYKFGVPSFRNMGASSFVQFSVPDIASTTVSKGDADTTKKGSKENTLPEGLRSHVQAYANLQNGTIAARSYLDNKIYADVEQAGGYANYVKSSAYQENIGLIAAVMENETQLQVLEKVLPFYKEEWIRYGNEVRTKDSGNMVALNADMQPIQNPKGGYYTYNEYLNAIDSGDVGVNPLGGPVPAMFSLHAPIQQGAAEDYFLNVLVPASNKFITTGGTNYQAEGNANGDATGYWAKTIWDKSSNKQELDMAASRIISSMPVDALRELKSDFLLRGGDLSAKNGTAFSEYVIGRIQSMKESLISRSTDYDQTIGLDPYADGVTKKQLSYMDKLGNTQAATEFAVSHEEMLIYEDAYDASGKPITVDGKRTVTPARFEASFGRVQYDVVGDLNKAIIGQASMGTDPETSPTMMSVNRHGFLAANGSIITNSAHLNGLNFAGYTGEYMVGAKLMIDPQTGKYVRQMPRPDANGKIATQTYLGGVVYGTRGQIDRYLENAGDRRYGSGDLINPDGNSHTVNGKTVITPGSSLTPWNPVASRIRPNSGAARNSGLFEVSPGVWGMHIWLPMASGQGHTVPPSTYNYNTGIDLHQYAIGQANRAEAYRNRSNAAAANVSQQNGR